MSKFTNWLKRRPSDPYFLYSLVTLLVLAPLLAPGFVLTLDMTFVPNPPLPDEIRSSYPFYAILHFLGMVIPADFLQKIVLVAILLMSGIGAHKLAQKVLPINNQIYQWAYYFAGILYMVNPFVYSRFMAGQFAVLLGYALLPFFVRSLLIFMESPQLKTAAILAAWGIAIAILSLHSIGLLAVAAVVAIALALWHYRQQKLHIAKLLKFSLLAILIWLVGNSFWLVPTVFGQGSVAESVAHFDAIDRQAFATLGNNWFEILLNIVRLQGFWADGRGLYSLPQQIMPLWGLVALAVVGLAIAGGIYLYKKQRFLAVFWLTCSLAAIILASGFFGGWLSSVVPFFAGYREPHKFVALLALAYAILGTAGVIVLAKKFKNIKSQAVIFILCALLPFALAPTMLWGFNGQLYPTNYPQDWYEIRQQLQQDSSGGQTLFLPWHQYMVFGFSGRIIENPAPKFMQVPMIYSNDPEYKGVKPTNPNPIVDKIGNLLADSKKVNFAQKLADLNIKYILLAHEFDFADYNYLNDQQELRSIQTTDNLTVYENLAWEAK